MDRQKDNLVLKGMNNVHSGLGILLGAGRISANTHEQILTLLNDDDMESGASGGSSLAGGAKKANPGSWRGNHHHSEQADPDSPVSLIDLQHGINNMTVADRPFKRAQPSSITSGAADSATTAWPPSNSTIVCPWFLTPGFRCRDQEKGRCAWAHEEIPNGTTDPLICHFWAENRCTKADSECKFAHYWAQHRQFAPLPGGSKWKKEKGSKTSSFDVW
ncbi:Brasilane terpene glycosides biosynthesis cluster protein D [Apiospora arundinis]|uniref:Brasilane terpene glycosides biosynthesis cluster protein D n=1 Tax=Apiospora arundinis TaxID=335852 RepID=A0ABR2I7H9_9PEZI